MLTEANILEMRLRIQVFVESIAALELKSKFLVGAGEFDIEEIPEGL